MVDQPDDGFDRENIVHTLGRMGAMRMLAWLEKTAEWGSSTLESVAKGLSVGRSS